MKVFLKKIVFLSLCFVLIGCTGKENVKVEDNPVEKINKLGDTVETENYKITLKQGELTESILVCRGDDANKETFVTYDDFFTPTTELFVDENGYVVDGIHGFKVENESIYFYYNIEFEYIGKTERTVVDLDFVPKIKYNEEYVFDSNYFAFYRTKSNSEISTWANFNGDKISLVRTLGLEVGYFNGKISPLSGDRYEVRGVINLPRLVYEDKNPKIEFTISGQTFVIE